MIFSPQDKILANLDYVMPLVRGENPPPILVEIDPSNTCNHGCYFCISSYIHLPESKDLKTYDKTIMSQDLLLEICKQLADFGTKAVNFTGAGEPTVNPGLKAAINLLGERSMPMGMFTNGTLLEKNELYKAVVKHLTWVRFSIDAGTRDTYNSIRRVKPAYGWEKMVHNLNLVIEEKKETKSDIDIGTGFVITEDNYKEILDFANFFKDYDISYCQFKPEIVNREREDGVQIEIEFWEKILPLIEEAKKLLGNKFQMNTYKLEDLVNDRKTFGRTYKKCLGSQLQPCVGADGNVYVCTNHRGYKEYSYGSLHEKSFKDIWNDITTRKAIMHQIEEKECFSNCTELCKPHESNKKLWEIYQDKDNEKYANPTSNNTTSHKHSRFI